MAEEEQFDFTLDESELSGENGQIYLFQWLSSSERGLRKVAADIVKSNQPSLVDTFIKIITAGDPYPPSGRPTRNLVARCLVGIYTRGETKTLFDTMQSLLKIVGDLKSTDKDVQKTAAFYCIGELMGAFGSQVMSLMVETATTSLKTLKASSSPLLRSRALIALSKALTSAGRAVTEPVAKDIIKQAKNALTDKALPVQRAAVEVLIVMYPADDPNRTASDVESIVVLCTKSLETSDHQTRRALSRLVGHLLASTQAFRAPPPPEPVKKSKKGGDGGEEEENDIAPPPPATLAPPKTICTPNEMLSMLSSQIAKPNASRKTRIGIFEFYVALFTAIGPSFVESNYALIVKHLLHEVALHPRSTSHSKYETLLMRRLVGILLRDLIGVRMLSEQGQIAAIQELATSYLRKWPALLPGQAAPDKLILAIVLKEVAGLLEQLGNAPPPVQDALSDPLVTLLSHPSHTIRVNTAWALRAYTESTPLRLPKIVLTLIETLQRDLASLLTPSPPADITQRALGRAYGLSALFAVIAHRPLYVSADVSAKVLDMAIQLLKGAGEHDLKIASVEVEVAWTSIAALMALGPNFVRSHLPQLLVLWRNALPKPTSKDTSANEGGRGPAEWMFLLHVRESALGAILCFLRHNSPTLVTLDVARRIASWLTNALAFANAFQTQNKEDHSSEGAAGAGQSLMSFQDMSPAAREALLRRRVYQCFAALGFSGITDATQTSLLQSVVSLFASSEGYAGSSVQAAIASSSGTFTSIWQSSDGYAYGLTGINISTGDGLEPGELTGFEGKDKLNRDLIGVAINELLTHPIIGSWEHDPLLLCLNTSSSTEVVAHSTREPPPPFTAVVDAAMELFAQLLPLQDAVSSTRILTQMIDATKSAKLEKNLGRKSAVGVNATVALTLALRYATTTLSRPGKDALGNQQAAVALAPFLKNAVIDGDDTLRLAGSEAIGRLASLAGTNFLTSQVKTLVDQVVNNRDPYGRAGCALAFGAIHSHVGGLAAGPLLKTTVNVLMSLSSDPHPVVHFYSLQALAQVINAASLGYAPYVSSTLGMLFKIYTLDTHEPEGGSVQNANTSGDLPAYQVVCQIIDSVTTVLGPDIQESTRTRTLILDLIREFASETDEGICVEALKCIQHFLMFAPDSVDIPELVLQFRVHLSSSRRALKLASINALYQLVQRDAMSMSRIGGDRLVEDLFKMLDDDPSIDGVRNVISSWLQQTVIHNPSAWIDLCQRIMSRTTASQQVADAASKGQANFMDDEGESFAVGVIQDSGSTVRGGPTSRWRTQLFALECLHTICRLVAESGRREHLDSLFARSQGVSTTGLLVSRVPDLIKMAFTASAAYVTEIRLKGLVVLRDVIEIFSSSPDPEYPDALLLEQHQAPITAALTPAFSADSTPEILASAVEACAIFVGCGVLKDVNRMGRILKLLTSALEQSKGSGMVTLGDAGELSPNASVMLRVSTLSAWAKLQIASAQQAYLKEVIKPYRSLLISLWISSLRDYASIRADTELLQESSATTAVDSSYSSLGRELLLPYYTDSWTKILGAVASSMIEQDPAVLIAMDGLDPTDSTTNVLHRKPDAEEPTALFFVLFGLVFEALATSSADSTSTPETRQTSIAALRALRCLVRPEYSGKALFEPTIFEELTSLCYRMAMTEPPSVLIHLVGAIASLARTQSSRFVVINGHSDPTASDSPQMHCLRICAQVLRNAIPSASRSLSFSDSPLAERIDLIRAAFAAFQVIGSALGSQRHEEIRAISVALYADLLKSESTEVDLIGPTLQSLKTALERPHELPDPGEKYAKLVHGLLSDCLLNIDAMRGRRGLISTLKVKNNMLAAVLILTVIHPAVRIGQGVVEHCCFLITQKLLEANDTSLSAAHCAKTLVIASTSGNIMLQHCTKVLMPGMVEYVANAAALPTDQADYEKHVAAVGEILKAFSAFFSSVAEESRGRVLGILLPTIVLLLEPGASPLPSLHTQGVSQLLAFATAAPAAFRDATAKLDATPRETLESSVRLAVSGKAGGSQQAAKPQISLRSF